jgi:uncharacterized protein YndB with AHSA1/START domain
MILRTVTKSVSIDASISKVFAFLADAGTWPRWAIVNVKAIKKAEGDWWDMQTPIGAARLRIRPNERLGILGHDFVAPDANWTVPARVVPNGSGSLFMITFFQPPGFTDEFFDRQTAFVDQELARLKEILEGN